MWSSWASITWIRNRKPKPTWQKFNITYPNGPDLGTRISQAFRMQGVPETYIIDQDGVLQHMQYGVFPSIETVKAVVDPLLENHLVNFTRLESLWISAQSSSSSACS